MLRRMMAFEASSLPLYTGCSSFLPLPCEANVIVAEIRMRSDHLSGLHFEVERFIPDDTQYDENYWMASFFLYLNAPQVIKLYKELEEIEEGIIAVDEYLQRLDEELLSSEAAMKSLYEYVKKLSSLLEKLSEKTNALYEKLNSMKKSSDRRLYDSIRRRYNFLDDTVHAIKDRIEETYYDYVSLKIYVEQYIRFKHIHNSSSGTVVNYSMDIDNNRMYLIFRLNYQMNNNFKTYTAILEYDLCSKANIDILNAEFGNIKIFEIEAPVPIIEDILDNKNILLYLSNKRRKDIRIPKYLPMHISSEFYDFISNKLFHYDMIFSSHSKPLIRDRHFNRVDAVLAKIESLKVATHIPLQEDVITMRSGSNNRLLAVLIMEDLAVVKMEQ